MSISIVSFITSIHISLFYYRYIEIYYFKVKYITCSILPPTRTNTIIQDLRQLKINRKLQQIKQTELLQNKQYMHANYKL